MKLEVNYEDGPDYLIIYARGEWLINDVRREMKAAREEADRRGQKRLLLDMRELLPPRTEMIRFESAELLAKLFGPPFKVAALGRAENITGFGETVAVNRGAHFAVFSDEEAAHDWLIQKSGREAQPKKGT